jgi:prepilin-type N-terminal cleavage/methylation domain-containing protein
MINRSVQHVPVSRLRSARRKASGFTLIELMVAMGVFLVIGGAAMSLFSQHAKLFGDQQSQAGLNISLRNSLAQMQGDAVNAANGFFQSSTSAWPIGVTITNVAGGFDTLNIITAASIPAPLNAGCILTTGTTVTIVPPAGLTAAQFNANDEILFLNGAGNQMTTAKLSAAGAAAGANITLTFNPTNADGTNSAANDKLGITTQLFDSSDNDKLATQFCQNTGDWVVKLSSITYTVNAANQLTRQVGANAADVVADQIIAFKVGASTYVTTGGGTSTSSYRYDAPGYKANLIRSVRVSLIGRTPPSLTTFKNTFDGGNYKIEALSLIINPRNLTMND